MRGREQDWHTAQSDCRPDQRCHVVHFFDLPWFELGGHQRLSHGFQIQASYTFSKSIDTSSSGIAGDTFGNSVSSPPVFDPRLRRGFPISTCRNILAITPFG